MRGQMHRPQAALHIADVTDPQEVTSLVDTAVKRFGRLDFLVNNAAVRFETPFAEIKLEEWRRVLSIVLDGAFLCTQACLPLLIRAGGGAVVQSDSLDQKRPDGQRAACGKWRAE